VQWSQFAVAPTTRPMFGPIATSDGYVMLAIASEKTFQGLMKVIGHPEWVSDARFANYGDRRTNWSQLMEGVEVWSHGVTTEQCLAALNEAGVPSSAYRTGAQALAVPQVGRKGCRGQAGLDAWRAHACAVEGDGPVGGPDRGILRETACRTAK